MVMGPVLADPTCGECVAKGHSQVTCTKGRSESRRRPHHQQAEAAVAEKTSCTDPRCPGPGGYWQGYYACACCPVADPETTVEPRALAPEAVLTWASVRNLETHTDIGPGNVGPLLIEVNFRQHQQSVALLRAAGYEITRSADA